MFVHAFIISNVSLSFLTDSRMSEMDWQKDGVITFKEWVFSFESWVGLDDDLEDDE